MSGKAEADPDLPPNAQPWKPTLASNLCDKPGASTVWVSKRMRPSSASYLLKLLS